MGARRERECKRHAHSLTLSGPRKTNVKEKKNDEQYYDDE